MTRIYEARHPLLIHAEYKNPAEHQHKAAHIIISTQETMTVKSNGTTYLCKGVIIPPGFFHIVDTHGSTALIFLYDCTTNQSKQKPWKKRLFSWVNTDARVITPMDHGN